MVNLFSREMLKLHGLLEHIYSDWASRFLDAVWKDTNRLARLYSILGTWFAPEDCISMYWFIETPMIINME